MKGIMNNMSSRGFTLIELLVVIALIGILAGVGSSNYFGIRRVKIIQSDLSSMCARIQGASINSKSQKDGEQWGVHLVNTDANNDYYEIWRGDSYVSGTVIDKIQLHSQVKFISPANSSTKDIIFAKATGLPISADSIIIVLTGGGHVATVDVASSGRISCNFEKDLIGYWPLDEGSGSVAFDSSGDNDGIFVNTPEWMEVPNCKKEACLDFNWLGIGPDYVNLGDSDVLKSDSITLSAWAYNYDLTPTDVAGVAGNIAFESGWKGLGIIMEGDEASGDIAALISPSCGNCYTIKTSWPPAENTWYHIAVTHDSDNNLNTLYVNGVAEASTTKTLDFASNRNWVIGSLWDTGFAEFPGRIDDVRIYSRALSAGEIQRIYNATK